MWAEEWRGLVVKGVILLIWTSWVRNTCHGPPRLWPQASHFTSIASSIEWDVKPKVFIYPSVYARASKRSHTRECVRQKEKKKPKFFNARIKYTCRATTEKIANRFFCVRLVQPWFLRHFCQNYNLFSENSTKCIAFCDETFQFLLSARNISQLFDLDPWHEEYGLEHRTQPIRRYAN
jgi:hypothetical protein